MNRNRGERQRDSRFGPPNTRPYGNPSQLQLPTHYPSKNSYDSFPNNRQIQPPQNILTPEQVAFELEFTKWEKSFDDWKGAYANHPDRSAYRQYEQKFLDVREKLLLKRAQIYKTSVPLELQLDLQLNAASQMAESILSKFGGDPSQPKFPPSQPSFGPSQLNFGPSQSNFGPSQSNFGPPKPNFSQSFNNNNFNQNSRRDDRFGNRNNRSSSPYLNRSPPPPRSSMNTRRDSNAPQRRDFNRSKSPQRSGKMRNEFPQRNRDGGRNNSSDRNRGRNRDVNKLRQEKPKDPKEIYPNAPWIAVVREVKPALVGKRRKMKNKKILNVLETKEKIASGEIIDPNETEDEKLARMMKIARSLECPPRLSGAARRRMVKLLQMEESGKDWDDHEKAFMEYVEVVRKGREKYFEKLDKSGDASSQDVEMKTSEDGVKIDEEVVADGETKPTENFDFTADIE